jgi:tRNA threonylcarbamoyladenosine biosynthesis protein TsaE
LETISYELSELKIVASALIKAAQNEKIWIFQGQMGAGKTTLIKAIAHEFGVLDQVSSPTFGIVNHYENKEGNTFYHFDFYRVEDPTEALDIGIEEYFYSGNHCWLEWAENIEEFLPEDFFLIKIESISDFKRQVSFLHIHDAI